jgi:hypothetical protein
MKNGELGAVEVARETESRPRPEARPLTVTPSVNRTQPATLMASVDHRLERALRVNALRRVILISAAVVLFIAISGLLARFLSIENVERDDDLALIEAEARGDASGMLTRLSGCRESPSCLASVKANASNPRLRRPGAVKILALTSPTAYSLTGATGTTRLAWTVIGRLPVVQCVTVRRSGNFLTGVTVTLLSLSAPIPNEGDC